MSINQETKQQLENTVKKLCANGKGILAADESTGTIGKRFANIDVENTLENRRIWRKVLFTTQNLEKFISGVIVYQETLFDETNLVQPLKDKNILVGIKTDCGLTQGVHATEKWTKGLDDLRERSQKAFDHGARFAKWRCVYNIDEKGHLPSDLIINENARTLAKYARISQECGLVPIVEPEILMDGKHPSSVCANTMRKVLGRVFESLREWQVWIPGIILKTGFCVPGKNCKQDDSNLGSLAGMTITAFHSTLPKSLPGVFFLSGGLDEWTATQLLQRVNKYSYLDQYLSFSFGRALQTSALKAWKGKTENIKEAQKQLLIRCQENSQAIVLPKK